MPTNSNSEFETRFDFKDLFLAVRLRAKILSIILLTCMTAFTVSTFFMAKKYKATATINVYSKFFQSPMMQELAPPVADASELRAERESLIRLAFDDAFVDRIGENYNLYQYPATHRLRKMEREELAKRFEVFAVNATTFRVAFTASEAELSALVAQEALRKVEETLIEHRKRTIRTLRDAVRSRIESMAMSSEPTTDPLASARPEVIEREMARLQGQWDALKNRYTEQHPSIQKIKSRLQTLRTWLSKPGHAQNLGASTDKALVGGEANKASSEVYQELLKKYNYLNIALEMETDSQNVPYFNVIEAPAKPSSPIWPKKSVFMLWGLMAGLMLSALYVLVEEFLRGARLNAEQCAEALGVVLIGELPPLNWEGSQQQKFKTTKRGPHVSGGGTPSDWH